MNGFCLYRDHKIHQEIKDRTRGLVDPAQDLPHAVARVHVGLQRPEERLKT